MENLWMYFIKANIILAIGFFFYKLLLANQRGFQLNRFLLLLIGVLALVSPFINQFSVAESNAIFTLTLPEIILNPVIQTSTKTINWILFGLFVYMSVSAFVLMRLALQIAGLLRANQGEKSGKYFIIDSDRFETSSFFNRIFLKNTLDNSAREIALTHEKVHADQWHTLDVIWLELLTAVFWLNPAVWLLKKELRDTHEYIADEKTNKLFGRENYLNAILNHTFNSQSINFLPKFSNSQTLKNRIIMMKTNHPVRRLRYALFLPLIAVITIASANTTAMRAMPELIQLEQTQVQPQDSTYTMVEQMPEFPGGEAALFEFLSKNVRYPESAKKEKIEGRVYVTFVISDEGIVKDVSVIRGVRADIDNEAIRVVRAMPNWKPGTHNGKNVNVLYNLPMSFKLNPKK